MKKRISDFVKSLGGSTQYSGKKRVVYIHGERREDILGECLKKFGKHNAISIKAHKAEVPTW